MAGENVYASNPYDTQFAGDPAATLSATQGAQSMTNQLNSQLSQTSGQSYPTMTNSYGLGQMASAAANPVGAVTGSASAPSFAANPVTSVVPDASSRGFNPWSLTGEALARGK